MTPFPTKYDTTAATAANSVYLETMLRASNCCTFCVTLWVMVVVLIIMRNVKLKPQSFIGITGK